MNHCICSNPCLHIFPVPGKNRSIANPISLSAPRVEERAEPMSQKKLPWSISESTPVKPLQKAGMIVDLRRCVGCHSCSVSCKTEHGVPLGTFRNRTQVVQQPSSMALSFVPMLCMHCADAPCMKACPSSAITRGQDGRVLLPDR